MNRIQLAAVCVLAFGAQAYYFYSVGWNYGQADGIRWARVEVYGDRHAPQAMSLVHLPTCVELSAGPMEKRCFTTQETRGDYLGCNNGMGYFAARSDGICYAADGPH